MFSCTAPVITEDDEKAERLARTEAENLAIQHDLYGTSTDGTSTAMASPSPDLLQALLAEMQTYIDEIPNKPAYERALELDLIERETKHSTFLRAAECNPKDAAQRIVEYWKVRRKNFGQDKAFRPMTLENADPDEQLAHGTIRLLPRDRNGRPVLFLDRVRCFNVGMKTADILRCLTYLLHALDDEEGRGIVTLLSLKGLELYTHFDRTLVRGFVNVMNSAPIRWRATHLYTSSSKSVLTLVLPIYKQLAGKHHRARIMMHVGDGNQAAAALGTFGIEQKNLDTHVGGFYDTTNVAEWLEERHRVESSSASTATTN